MGWNVDSAIQAQNLVAQISTRLTANGWTLYDNVAGAPVHTATNNQGVTMYLQVSQSGSYTYIQFQGWRLWNAGTHTGTSGSNTAWSRMYLGGSPIAAATTVDLYSSVTANRAIFLIYSQSTNYRSWFYGGGLDSVAGTNDPGCYVVISSYEATFSAPLGQILDSPGGNSSTYWAACYWMFPMYAVPSSNSAADSTVSNGTSRVVAQMVTADSGKIVLFPILCASAFAYPTGWSTGLGPPILRGNMDGLLFCPLGSAGINATTGSGVLSHLDTVTIGGTTYMVWQPGGTPTANAHPWTGSYVQGIAISET